MQELLRPAPATRFRKLEHGPQPVVAAGQRRTIQISSGIHNESSLRRLSIFAVPEAVQHTLTPATVGLRNQFEHGSQAIGATRYCRAEEFPARIHHQTALRITAVR